MQSLTDLRNLARWVLVWFALSLGAAIASPLVKPRPMELICSGAGAIMVQVQTDAGVTDLSNHALDCPLCAGLGAPPRVTECRAEPVQPRSYVLGPIAAAHIAWLTAAPLPARGPPSHS